MSPELIGTKVWCHIAGEYVNHAIHDDDIVVLAPSVKYLQKLLEMSLRSFEVREILLISTKIVTMHFWPEKHKGTITRPFTTGGVHLESVDEVKYLGHVICPKIKDDFVINGKLGRINTVENFPIRKISSCDTKVI